MLAVRAGTHSAARLARRSPVTIGACLEEYHGETLCRSSFASSSSSSSSSTASSSSHRHFSSSSRRCDTETNESTVSAESTPPPRRKTKKEAWDPRNIARKLRKASLASRTTATLPGLPLPENDLLTGPTLSISEQVAEILEDNPLSTRGNEYDDGYRTAYKKAHTRMNHAFLVGQLREMVPEEYIQGFGKQKSKLPKPILIQHIMLTHGWPVPLIKEKQVQEPVTKQNLDLPENELFLFLRDTRVVSDLVMNKGIRFSVIQPPPGSGSAGASVLCAEATEKQLTTLNTLIENRRQHMTTLTVSPETIHYFKPSSGLIQFISTATGAFVETWTGETYRLSSMDPVKVSKAQRLLQIAAIRSHVLPPSRELLVLSPTPESITPHPQDYFPDTQNLYSLLPYFASPSMNLPWDSLSESFSEMSYRLRRVSSWAPKIGKRETSHRDEELEGAPSVQLGSDDDSSVVGLGERVQKMTGDGNSRVVNLTFGHLLLQNKAAASQLSPPVKGQWPFIESRSNLSQISRPIFSPSLTPLMIHHRLSNPPRHFRKLTYRTPNGQKLLSYTYTYPAPAPPVEKVEEKKEDAGNWLAQLEKMLAEVEEEDKRKSQELMGAQDVAANQRDGVVDDVVQGDAAPLDPSADTGNTALTETLNSEDSVAQPAVTEVTPEQESPVEVAIEIEQSDVVEIDVMMPDRPIDSRLTIRTKTAGHVVPDNVKTFFDSIASGPLPWLTTQPEKKTIKPIAPIGITLPGSSGESAEETDYVLESDESLEVVESYTPGDDVVLKHVQSRDMVLGMNRVVSHTELEYEGAELPIRFWREFANISKDLGAESAGARGRGLFL